MSGCFAAQDAQRLRQPHQFLTGEKADREGALLRLCRAARGFARRIDLKQRQTRVIEKSAAGRGERDAARAALQQWDADLEFEVADLPAQRWLRGMQPPFGGIGQAAFLGNGNEIAQVAQLHGPYPYLIKYGLSIRSLGFPGKRSPPSCPKTMHGASSRTRTKTMTTLANKTALVTGASRGMGRATALALGAAGARVIVHYGRNADEAKAVVDQIRAKGGQADAVAADLAAPDGAHVLAAEVRNLAGGKLDILVSNAGISNAATIETISVKEFDSLFAVNVRAPYFLVQQLLPIMGEGGTIVFVSSLGARAAVGTLAAYASTKGAINTLVKYLASALGPRGIRVNAVAPGVIDTDMSNFTKTEAGRATVMGMQSLKRIGQPDDVASVIAFLASDASRWITGDIIAVDGGSKL